MIEFITIRWLFVILFIKYLFKSLFLLKFWFLINNEKLSENLLTPTLFANNLKPIRHVLNTFLFYIELFSFQISNQITEFFSHCSVFCIEMHLFHFESSSQPGKCLIFVFYECRVLCIFFDNCFFENCLNLHDR